MPEKQESFIGLAPGVLLLLPPAVGPTQDDGVRLHSSKAGSLDAEINKEMEIRISWKWKSTLLYIFIIKDL